jgi:hypothetical protein
MLAILGKQGGSGKRSTSCCEEQVINRVCGSLSSYRLVRVLASCRLQPLASCRLQPQRRMQQSCSVGSAHRAI